MIPQFKMLTTVKKLREDKALRALQTARSALRKAEEKAERLRIEAEESTRTLPIRETEIYDRIMRKVVGLGAVDEAKERMLLMLEEHQNLLDRRDRAFEYVKRCEQKVEEARKELRKRQADVEKIETITNDLIETAEAEAIAKEEAEIEDLFSKPITKPQIGVEGAA